MSRSGWHRIGLDWRRSDPKRDPTSGILCDTLLKLMLTTLQFLLLVKRTVEVHLSA